ncbi:MAG: histidine kinase [Ignavibacteria bacterium]|nr:histidine kinase [Ignavibacteria bacterium]
MHLPRILSEEKPLRLNGIKQMRRYTVIYSTCMQMFLQNFRAFPFTLVVLFLISPQLLEAQKLDPLKKCSQYIIKNWQVKDGLPQNSVVSIYQTADGYMWFGSYEGLFRFNGVRFTVFTTANLPQLKSNRIVALCEDDNKVLYIATSKAVIRYKNGRFEDVICNFRNNSEFVMTGHLLKDKYGTLWAQTDANRLYKLEKDRFTEVCFENKTSPDFYYTMIKGGDGCIYINTRNKVYCFNNSGITSYDYKKLLPNKVVLGLASEPGGTISIICQGTIFSLSKHTSQPFAYRENFPNVFTRDYNGAIWTAMPDLTRYTATTAENMNLTSAIGKNIIICVYFDREGNMWVGTDGAGLFKISEPKVSFLSRDEGLKGDVVWSVCEDNNGTIWSTSMQSVIGKITNSKIENIPLPSPAARMYFIAALPLHDGSVSIACSKIMRLSSKGLENMFPQHSNIQGVQALYEDENGTIWGGSVFSGLYIITKDSCKHIDKSKGILHGYISAITGDRHGNVFVGSRGGLQIFHSGRLMQNFTIQNGLSDAWVRTLFYDSRGSLWIGTDYGLNRLDKGKIISYTTSQGLYNNVFHTILEDNSGNLWFSCNTGIYSVPKSQFFQLDQKKISHVHYTLYTRADGLKSEEGNGSTQPAGWKTKDGRLLFAMSKGIAVISPEKMSKNTISPPVFIEDAAIDDSVFSITSTGKTLSLTPGNHNLSFTFYGLSYSNSNRNNYSIILKGFEDKYRVIGNKNEATYTNIPPGEYTFIVLASNNDGIWNRLGDSLVIKIPKPYYATIWFQTGTGLFFMILVGFAVFKISQIKSRRKMLQMEHEIKIERERTRISKDIHDEVGSSLTKISILAELAKRQKIEEGKLSEQLQKISLLSREAITNVSEIVWAMNTRNDGLNNFAAYVREYIQKELEDTNIECDINFPDELPELSLSTEHRRNLFLIIKEIVHNCIKHSNATRFTASIEFATDAFTLICRDNGKGFEIGNTSSHGNGLTNMSERAGMAGAEIQILSADGMGTEIRITLRNTTFV